MCAKEQVMRVAFAGIFILLCFGLTYCNIKAHRSPKAIGKSVARLVAALVPPVIGNLIIISSTDQTLSTIGCYAVIGGPWWSWRAMWPFAGKNSGRGSSTEVVRTPLTHTVILRPSTFTRMSFHCSVR